MTTSLPTLAWSRGAALMLALSGGAGCQIIAGIDRSEIESSGAGGSSGFDGSGLGIGGSSGIDQDAEGTPDSAGDDVSIGETGAGGTSTDGTGGAGGSSGSGGATPPGGGGSANVGGTVNAGGGPSDGSVAAPDSGSNCGGTVPAGWSLAIYSATNADCPTGFPTHAILGTPTVGATACTCPCTIAQPGSCNQGTLTATFAPGQGNDNCVTNWFSQAVNGSCVTVAGVGSDHVQANVLPAQAGTCSATPVPNNAQLAAPAQRYCDVPSAQSTPICNGMPQADFAACVMFPGNTTCTGPLFTRAFHVEDGVTLGCSTCTACSVATTCSNASIAGYTNTTCGGTPITIPVTGGCVDANPNEATISSIIYSATPSSTCTSGTSIGSAQLTGPRTFCCR